MSTDNKSEIVEAKKVFIKGFNHAFPDWFNGAGLGLPAKEGDSWYLNINVKTDADVATAEQCIKDNNITVPYKIQVIGTIKAL